jgi:hypothetical protein
MRTLYNKLFNLKIILYYIMSSNTYHQNINNKQINILGGIKHFMRTIIWLYVVLVASFVTALYILYVLWSWTYNFCNIIIPYTDKYYMNFNK